MLATNLRRGRKAPRIISTSTADTGGTSGTGLVINVPAGVQAGDVLVAFMWADGPTTWSGDGGWTEVLDPGTSPNIRIAYKLAGASEGYPTPFYAFSSAQNVRSAGVVVCVRGAAWDVLGSTAQIGGTSALVLPSVTSAGGLILAAYGTDKADTYTTPTGMTAVAAHTTPVPGFAIFSQAVAAGATGTRSSTPSASANRIGAIASLKTA